MAKAKKKTKAAAKTKAKKPVKKAAAKRATPRRAAAAAKRAATPAVVHWEVQARDLERQQQFFSNLFGWKIDTNNPMSYGMVSGAGKDTIGGGIGPAQDAARVTVYVQVPDINATLERATTLGGQTVMPKSEYGPVTMALFRDLEGNVIGLVED